MERVFSQRGKEKFSHNGYLFIFDKFSRTDTDLMFWRCELIGRCKARIHTKFGDVVKFMNTHTHNCSPISEVVKMARKIKSYSRKSMESPDIVIDETLGSVIRPVST